MPAQTEIDFLMSLSDADYVDCITHPDGETLSECIQSFCKLRFPNIELVPSSNLSIGSLNFVTSHIKGTIDGKECICYLWGVSPEALELIRQSASPFDVYTAYLTVNYLSSATKAEHLKEVEGWIKTATKLGYTLTWID